MAELEPVYGLTPFAELIIDTTIVLAWERGESPSLEQIADRLGLPAALLRQFWGIRPVDAAVPS